MALDEDAADVAIDIGDRLEDEIQHAVFFRGAAGALQTDVNAGADEGLAAAVDPVEDFDEALALHFRQRIAHRLADDLALADEPAVGRVDHSNTCSGPRSIAIIPGACSNISCSRACWPCSSRSASTRSVVSTTMAITPAGCACSSNTGE